eukprot:scaffold91270_cov45-Phaeocystis_antarctica.AAC.2
MPSLPLPPPTCAHLRSSALTRARLASARAAALLQPRRRLTSWQAGRPSTHPGRRRRRWGRCTCRSPRACPPRRSPRRWRRSGPSTWPCPPSFP